MYTVVTHYLCAHTMLGRIVGPRDADMKKRNDLYLHGISYFTEGEK